MNINYYNPYVRQELYLMHHGIFGQHWGKKNGPPYPLDASDHSASEKKAGWRKSLDNDGASKSKKAKTVSKASVKTKKESKNTVMKSSISNVSSEQKAKGKAIAKKALLIGGGIALAAAATYAGSKAIKSRNTSVKERKGSNDDKLDLDLQTISLINSYIDTATGGASTKAKNKAKEEYRKRMNKLMYGE